MERLAGILDDFEIPRRFTIGSLRAHLAEQRGRPLLLRGAPWSADDLEAPTGMVVSTESADIIYYRRDTSLFHRIHIVLHEFGHLLCAHQPIMLNNPVATDDPVLMRTSRSEVQEAEAEYVAALLSLRVVRGRNDVNSGLLSALGFGDDQH